MISVVSHQRRFSRRPITCLLVGVFSGVAVAGALIAADPTPAPRAAVAETPTSQLTISARELVRGMQKAVATIAKARSDSAGGAGAAARPTRKSAAFDESLAKCAHATDQLAEAINSAAGKDPFAALRRTGSAVAAFQVSYRYGGIKNEPIDHAFRTLTATYGILRRNYGRDLVAARNEAEEALNAAQKSALDELKTRGAECAKRLESARPQTTGNPAVAFECESMRRELTRLDSASRNRRAFLEALTTAEIFLGRWEGARRYAELVFPPDAPALVALDEPMRAFEAALIAGTEAAYSANGPQTFAQTARYTEDIALKDLSDADVERILGTMRSTAAVEVEKNLPPATPESINTAAAADRQINADDPDDDTSLDGGEDEEATASEQSREGMPPPR